jgi:hypothetical protein
MLFKGNEIGEEFMRCNRNCWGSSLKWWWLSMANLKGKLSNINYHQPNSL